MMTNDAPYPIGTPGHPWGDAEVATWLSQQTVQRSYAADVLSVIETLRSRFDVSEYGAWITARQLSAVRDQESRLARRASLVCW
jgi:predicted DNA-binding transcriptional regulator AlpA